MGPKSGKAFLQALEQNVWPHLQRMDNVGRNFGEDWGQRLAQILVDGGCAKMERVETSCASTKDVLALADAFDRGACPMLKRFHVVCFTMDEPQQDKEHCEARMYESLKSRRPSCFVMADIY